MYTMVSDNRSLPQLVYTVEEAASILKVSNKTVYRLVDRNLLHASKALRHLRITKKSLEQFLATTSGEEVRRGRRASERPRQVMDLVA